jgi:hypothetical protein
MYSSPNIIQVIKLRRMRWAGHVACMGEKRVACKILVGRPREGDHLGDSGTDGRIILYHRPRRLYNTTAVPCPPGVLDI